MMFLVDGIFLCGILVLELLFGIFRVVFDFFLSFMMMVFIVLCWLRVSMIWFFMIFKFV